VVLVLWLMWRRQWRAAVAMVVSGITVGIGSFLVAGNPADTLTWLRGYQSVNSALVTVYANNLALHGLVLRLFSSTPSAVPWLLAPWLVPVMDIVAAVWLAVLCVGALKGNTGRVLESSRETSDTNRLLLESGLVLAIGMTLGPLTEGDHLVLLLPGFVAVVEVVRHTRRASADVRVAWNWAALSWSAVMASELSPIPYTNFAGINITQLVGVRPAGLVALWTGRIALLLLALVLTTAHAMRVQSRLAEARSSVTAGEHAITAGVGPIEQSIS
jgi:hypothetical protein